MARFQAGILLALLAGVLWAQGKPSASSSSSARPSAQGKSPQAETGEIRDGVYRNSTFGVTCKIPFGWVDRTQDMREDSAEEAKSLLLLAVFERPPEAAGSTINSAIVIAAEKVSQFSGLKTAADYFGPITELATAQGFRVVNEPYEFPRGAMHLVRGDFSKARGTLTMHQTSLVMLAKGYALSLTFIGGSEDEVNQLIEKLSFSANKK
jgi:hypothetical protein